MVLQTRRSTVGDNTPSDKESFDGLNFQKFITQFSFTSPSRQGSQKHQGSSFTNITDNDPDGLPTPNTKLSNKRTSNLSAYQSPKKKRRGYSSPETYAHLYYLPDYLEHDLDVIFCGINPGYRSAEVGHHFANPTNHFWRCLYQSGFTSHLLLPSQDFTLPAEYSLGLTNLVDRPSVQQTELSPAEMAAAVPEFLQKIFRYRPRLVCFIGLGIWQIVQKALSKKSPDFEDITTSPRKSPKRIPTSIGLQPYKIVYPKQDNPGAGTPPVRSNSFAVHSGAITETLVFAMPSTSGRVVSHQVYDKVKIFGDLRKCVEATKQSKIDTSQMAEILFSDIIHII